MAPVFIGTGWPGEEPSPALLRSRSLGEAQIIILNGTPRSGKSSIAAAIQTSFEGVWMNLGVDRFKPMTPERYQPGIGLRPGGEPPDLEPLVVALYRAMYEALAAHSRLGLKVVVDVGHHDAYSAPLGTLPDCARRLRGLPVVFVGVRCPIEVIMERRRATWGAGHADDGLVPTPVHLWQQAVHVPGIYDLEVDTSDLSREACADVIRQHLEHGPPPSAFQRLATIRRTIGDAERARAAGAAGIRPRSETELPGTGHGRSGWVGVETPNDGEALRGTQPPSALCRAEVLR